MSRTKDAVWDQLEIQYQNWRQSDSVASAQIEHDQITHGDVVLSPPETASDNAKMEF